MEQNRISNRNDEGVSIDVLELVKIFLRKIHVILLIGILGGLIAFVVTKYFMTPEYDSTSKIYILTRSNNETLTSSDLSLSNYLVKDYAELTLSRPVLEEVIGSLKLNMSVNQLRDKINVSSKSDTRILSITASANEPKLAKKIVDAVRELAAVQIQEVMDVDAVNTVEDGNLPVAPARPDFKKNILIGLILGIILTMLIIAIRHIVDDTIKTPEDVEKYLGLNVLASISEKEYLLREEKMHQKNKH